VAERAFADAHGDVLDTLITAIAEIDTWAKDNTDAVAAQLSPTVGIPAPILAVALKRQTYGVKPLDSAVVAEQQRIADTLHALGLLPKPVVIADAVRRAGS
jgi:sulfonate transport system substrate-binding protein